MNWISNHLQLVIAIAGAVAWWISQKKPEETKGGVTPGSKTFADPELAERTRRIREEIQRKIEQRARGYTQAPTPPARAPEPSGLSPVLAELMGIPQAPEPPSRPSAGAQLEARRDAEILEQQAALAEKLDEAREMKTAAMGRIQYEAEIAGKEVAKSAAHNAVKKDLQDPATLRRAFVLREILGPPVALR